MRKTISLWVREDGQFIGDQDAAIQAPGGFGVVMMPIALFRREFTETEDGAFVTIAPVDPDWKAPKRRPPLSYLEKLAKAALAKGANDNGFRLPPIIDDEDDLRDFVRDLLRAVTTHLYPNSAFSVINGLGLLAMHAENGGGEEYEKLLDEETQDLLEIWGDWAGSNQ